MIKTAFLQRFRELEDRFGTLTRHPSDTGFSAYIEGGEWKQWATSAQNLIVAVFGRVSPHNTNFMESFKECAGYVHQVEELQGIFLSAKEDFEGGYVFDVDLRVSGEIFGDLINLAKQALLEGHKDVAAVLACAALEDALKRFGISQGLAVEGKPMQEVINALKAGGCVSGAQRSLLDVMPKIRNHAMHADWGKIDSLGVSSVIGFVEQFLLSRFS